MNSYVCLTLHPGLYIKQLWKVLNQLSGMQQRDEIPGDVNATHFNDYFTSVGSDTVSHLNVPESDTLFWRGYNCVSRFELIAIQPEYSKAQLHALGLSSKTDAPGFDNITILTIQQQQTEKKEQNQYDVPAIFDSLHYCTRKVVALVDDISFV